MGEMEIRSIEEQLGIRLPSEYGVAMAEETHFLRFSRDDYGLLDDVESVVGENKALRELGHVNGHDWLEEYFCFAWDGMGTYYFIDSRLEKPLVYMTSCEEGMKEWAD